MVLFRVEQEVWGGIGLVSLGAAWISRCSPQGNSVLLSTKSDLLVQHTNNYTLERDTDYLHKPGCLVGLHKSNTPHWTFHAIIYRGSELVFFQGQPLDYLVISTQVSQSLANFSTWSGKGLHLVRVFLIHRHDFKYYNEDSSAVGYKDLESFAKLSMYTNTYINVFIYCIPKSC